MKKDFDISCVRIFHGNNRQEGFSLVELMIVILITSMVLGAAYTVFSSQQKTYTNQQSVADIQQNLRAGMYYLTREVRLAGYSESDTNPDAGFVLAGPGILQFTMDIFDNVDDDGDADGSIYSRWDGEVGFNDGQTDLNGENILYVLADDADQDGIADNGICALNRIDVNNGNKTDALMENVEAIGFGYAYDDDNDGLPELDSSGSENIVWVVDSDLDGFLDKSLDANGDGVIGDTGTLATPVNINRICMVRIWILVRSETLDPSITDDRTFILGLYPKTVDDHYRRRLLSASMVCRNKGGY